ncbi:hypothetical protein B0H13DRAFT_1850968 [Mycena leptocephala]|nr:hypothetical protein B0H13DRAFT_1850968 [Mycena leptocephala]
MGTGMGPGRNRSTRTRTPRNPYPSGYGSKPDPQMCGSTTGLRIGHLGNTWECVLASTWPAKRRSAVSASELSDTVELKPKMVLKRRIIRTRNDPPNCGSGSGFLRVREPNDPRPVPGRPDPETRRVDPNPRPTLIVSKYCSLWDHTMNVRTGKCREITK